VFSAVRAGLIARLTGKPFHVAAERLRDGLRASTRDRQHGGEAQQPVGSLFWPSNPHDVALEVTVFPYDITGKDVRTTPCVSVAVTAYKPRRDNRVFLDDIWYPVPGTEATITFDDGEVIKGPTLVETAPHPIPVTISFDIRAYASTDVELIAIIDRLNDILDDRTGLKVTIKSGEEITLDGMIEETLDPINVPGALLQSPEIREYSQVITYTVEAYRDTSDQRVRKRTITRRDIAFEDYVSEDVTDVLEEQGTREE